MVTTLEAVLMQVAIKKVDVEHEAAFSAPLFDLADRSPEVLRRLHDEVSPKYPIRSEDMWISKEVQLSEPQVGIDMFNGHGLIDVTVDRLAVSFKSLRNAGQAAICRNFISLSERTLKRVFPDVTVSTAAFKSTLSLRLDDEATNANQHLSQVTEPSFKGDLDAFGSVCIYPRVILDANNDEEQWRAFFFAHGRGKDPLGLSVTCRLWYYEGTAFRHLKDKLLHMELLLSAFLGGIDLDVAKPLFGMGEAE